MRQPFTLMAFLLSVSSLTPTIAQNQTLWTLDVCLNYALENNLQVKQSQNAVESAAADVKQSKAALLPSLSFSTQQQWGFQKVSSQSFTTRDASPKNPTYTGSYGLSASMTLFDGGANWNTYKQNKLTKQATQLQAEMTANNVQVQIIQAYYQILYARESVLTEEEIVNVAERELDRTRNKLSLGKGTRVDVAQMESQLEQNRYQLVTFRNQEASNVLSLKQLLQIAPDDEFYVNYASYSQEDVLAILPTLAESEQAALDHLPNMRAAELNVQAAELQNKIAKGALLPSVSFSAGVSTSNGNTYTGNFGEQLNDHLNENIGLNLNFPIFDNRRTRTAIDKAKIQYSNALIDQEDARLQLQNTIASLHLDILSAQSRYESAVAAEKSQKESFEMMEARFDAGLESVVDLLTQKNSYLQARQETLQAKFTALLNLELMRFYTGR